MIPRHRMGATRCAHCRGTTMAGSSSTSTWRAMLAGRSRGRRSMSTSASMVATSSFVTHRRRRHRLRTPSRASQCPLCRFGQGMILLVRTAPQKRPAARIATLCGLNSTWTAGTGLERASRTRVIRRDASSPVSGRPHPSCRTSCVCIGTIGPVTLRKASSPSTCFVTERQPRPVQHRQSRRPPRPASPSLSKPDRHQSRKSTHTAGGFLQKLPGQTLAAQPAASLWFPIRIVGMPPSSLVHRWAP
mmetsp:Transcript_2875/g.7479  ORF Transcript_2875/g.7479 Transcript_2875/m.7479 type:complete len:246 (-) Transcript_2875:185-922(-)